MLPDIENLLQLQEADREIRRLNEEIAALPKRVAAIEARLADTKAELEKAKAASKADEAARRKYENAIQDLQGKISKYRDQSLEVKTNEQYRALLHEIQFAEQEIRENEDKILELMVNAETREKQVKAAEVELKAETEEIEKEKADARQRTAEDEKQLTEWKGKRDKLRGGISPDLLRQYERVSKFRGTGIAEARDQKCMGCQVMLRPQTYNEVRAGDHVVYCDSCQRVLYFNPANEVVVERALQPARRRPRPKAGASQAWFYRPHHGQEGEVFLVFSNGNDGSSRRIYDLHTGRQIGDTLIREGQYHLAFPEDLPGAIRLNGSWSEEEIDAWGTEMPTSVLDVLQADLRAARREASSPPHPEPGQAHSAASEHPAVG